jgi:hypothetical protein
MPEAILYSPPKKLRMLTLTSKVKNAPMEVTPQSKLYKQKKRLAITFLPKKEAE